MTVNMTPPPIGHATRKKDWMEQLQISFMSAVAAAAGCNLSGWHVDDGVDCLVKYKADINGVIKTSYLEVQLKATSKALPPRATKISATMRKDRFDEFSNPNPSVHKIVVLMSIPKDQLNWVRSTRNYLELRHCCYWVNLAHSTSGAHRPSVSAPLSQVFDDRALRKIMYDIAHGGTP